MGSATTKCKRCGRFIIRDVNGVWVIPRSKHPSPMCRFHKPHEPDNEPPSGGNPSVTAIAVGAAVFDAGLI